MLANGPWALFRGYTASLDYLVQQAWDDINHLEEGEERGAEAARLSA